MPDISKINALAIGSVSKVDGLAKASILDIDGVAVPSGVAPPLDTYTNAEAAYSVRLLRTLYTGVAMRVRRDTAGGTGDNDEADVAFDSGVISLDSAVSNFSGTSNATNLGQFLNATGYTDADSLTVVADGFVDEWKDQSGNANHASQATFGSQPQIFDSASPTDLITENGKPAVTFDGGDDLSGSLSLGTGDSSSTFAVVMATNANPNNRLVNLAGAGTDVRNLTIIGYDGNIFDGSNGVSGGTVNDNTQALLSGHYSTNNGRIYVDGGLGGTATTFAQRAVTSFAIGAEGTFFLTGTLQEIIIFTPDQDTAGNRTGIETNMDDYYQIPGM